MRAVFPMAIKGEISLVCELFCGDHCSVVLKAVQKCLAIDVNATRSGSLTV